MSDGRDQYEDFLAGIDETKDQNHRETDFLTGITAHGGRPGEGALGPLGERVRTIREEQGLSLEDLSSRTGFEVSHLQAVEAGEVSPPLGELIKLGRALGAKMGYFISGGETRPYTVVRAEDRKRIARRALTEDKKYGYTYQALAPGKTDRHMEPFIVVLEPAEDEELSQHEGQEFIFVLEGRMEAVIGEDRMVLGPGDAIYYDSHEPHMVACVEGDRTVILAVLYASER